MFATVGLAGEIAAREGIVPWTYATTEDFSDSDSLNAAASLFQRWKDNRSFGGTFSNEHTKILSAVRDFIERFSDGRFSDLNGGPSITGSGYVVEPPIIRDRAGYWDNSSGSRVYLFTRRGLQEATKGHDFNRVLKALDDALRPDQRLRWRIVLKPELKKACATDIEEIGRIAAAG